MHKNKTYKLYQHILPGYFNKFPFLIWPVHWAQRLVHSRNRVTISLAKKHIRSNPVKMVLDAGCGEGNTLLALVHKFKNVWFKGLDSNVRLVEFLNAYRNSFRLNYEVEYTNFNQAGISGKFDMVLCIAVLQYLDNDLLMLNRIYNALEKGGMLFLNVPIKHNTVLPLTHRFATHYDEFQSAKTTQYTLNELLDLLKRTGFKIREVTPTNGRLGTAANELYNFGIDILQNKNWFIKLVFSPVFGLVAIPLVVMLNMLNDWLPKKRFSGVVVTAERA